MSPSDSAPGATTQASGSNTSDTRVVMPPAYSGLPPAPVRADTTVATLVEGTQRTQHAPVAPWAGTAMCPSPPPAPIRQEDARTRTPRSLNLSKGRNAPNVASAGSATVLPGVP